MLFSLKHKHGYDTHISRRTWQLLSQYFEEIDLPIAEEAICGFKDLYEDYKQKITKQRIDFIEGEIEQKLGKKLHIQRDAEGKLIISKALIAQYPHVNFEQLAHSKEERQVDDYSLDDLSSERLCWQPFQKEPIMELDKAEHRQGKAFILYPAGYTPQPNESEYLQQVPEFETLLRRKLTPKETYLVSARQSLDHAATLFNEYVQRRREGKKSKKRYKAGLQELVFVGIHHRLTDHLAWEQEKGLVTLKPSYFLKAMDLYRDHFNDPKTGRRVIFLYISDDMSWAKQYLTPRIKTGDLYYIGRGNGTSMASVGHDMSVMMLCNHTIISHGTFSYWMGFMAGGAVITPAHFHEFRGTHAKHHKRLFDQHPIEKPLPLFYPFV